MGTPVGIPVGTPVGIHVGTPGQREPPGARRRATRVQLGGEPVVFVAFIVGVVSDPPDSARAACRVRVFPEVPPPAARVARRVTRSVVHVQPTRVERLDEVTRERDVRARLNTRLNTRLNSCVRKGERPSRGTLVAKRDPRAGAAARAAPRGGGRKASQLFPKRPRAFLEPELRFGHHGVEVRELLVLVLLLLLVLFLLLLVCYIVYVVYVVA